MKNLIVILLAAFIGSANANSDSSQLPELTLTPNTRSSSGGTPIGGWCGMLKLIGSSRWTTECAESPFYYYSDVGCSNSNFNILKFDITGGVILTCVRVR